jgi:hypothetical protein
VGSGFSRGGSPHFGEPGERFFVLAERLERDDLVEQQRDHPHQTKRHLVADDHGDWNVGDLRGNFAQTFDDGVELGVRQLCTRLTDIVQRRRGEPWLRANGAKVLFDVGERGGSGDARIDDALRGIEKIGDRDRPTSAAESIGV